MARSFTGGTDVAQNTATTDIGATTAATVCCWFKPNWSSGDSVNHIPFQWTNAANSSQIRFYRDSSNVININFGGNALNVADTGFFSNGVWGNIVVVGNTASATSALYKNGASFATGISSAISGATILAVGNIASSIGSGFQANGAIADFAGWNVVLSALEIKQLAAGARPFSIRPKSLVAYYPLDGLESPEPDLSGAKLNLTLTGSAFAFGPPTTMLTPRSPQYNFAPPLPPFVVVRTAYVKPINLTA